MSRALLSVVLLAACAGPPPSPRLELLPEEPTTLDDLVLGITDSPELEDRAVDYAITWSVDGAEVADLADLPTVPADRTNKGEVWSVSVVPYDEKDRVGEAIGTEVTVVNTAPVAAVTLEPEAPTTNDALQASVTGEDADDDVIAYSWTWLRDGEDAGIDSDTVPAAETSKGEVWTVQVTPNDGDVDGQMVEAQISIDNATPVAQGVTLAPTEVYEETVLVATATGSDDDGDELTWRYTWFLNDVAVPDEDGDSLTGAAFSKGDQVHVEAVPFDGIIEGAAVRSDSLVVLNTPPSLESAVIDPTSAAADAEFTCTGTGWADVDGDPESLRFSWEVNGAVVGSRDTLTEGFAKGDSVTCVITPWDGEDEGAAVRSDTVVIANTPPVLTSVGLSPSSPRTADDITAKAAGVSDLDGDGVTLTFEWYVNGKAVAKRTTKGLSDTLGSSSFEKNDTVYVRVTPSDGEDGTPVDSKTLTIANTPPVITSAGIGPSPLYTTSTATASRAYTDADGDKLSESYAWTVDGSPVGGTSGSLASSAFEKGEKVAFTLTVSDGTDSATRTAGPIEVANSAPTAPSTAISPGSPGGSDDLVCEITTASTDADRDKLTYSFDWYRNGSLWTGSTDTTTFSGDTIAASDTTGGDSWYCIAVADDGTDDSPDGRSASVTVKKGATPTVGLTGTYGSFKPDGRPNDGWKICRTSGGTTWIAANSGGGFKFHEICKYFGYKGADAWGGTCGTVCGYCGTPGSERYSSTGPVGTVSGNYSSTEIYYTVHWRCAN